MEELYRHSTIGPHLRSEPELNKENGLNSQLYQNCQPRLLPKKEFISLAKYHSSLSPFSEFWEKCILEIF